MENESGRLRWWFGGDGKDEGAIAVGTLEGGLGSWRGRRQGSLRVRYRWKFDFGLRKEGQ